MSNIQSKKHIFWFLAPATILFALILLFPIVYSFLISFQDAEGVRFLSGNSEFIGLQNYFELFSDRGFQKSIWLLIVFIVSTTSIELLIALSVAIYLDQCLKIPKWIQTFLILPMFVIPVVSGLTFRYLFDPENGVIASIYFYFNAVAPDLLGEPVLAMGLIILQDIWRMWPFLFLIIFAGLKAMPREPFEAIKLDGAGTWDVCKHLIIPSLKHTIMIAMLLKVIESLKAFTEIYVMTGGGPGDSTNILPMYIVRQITDFTKYGFGSAASIILLVLGITAAVGLHWAKGSPVTNEAT